MDTATRQRIIADRRENAFKNERDYYEFQELTDISERLSLPVENPIPFIRGDDGYVYSTFGERVADVVKKGYDEAVAAAKYRHDIGFEVERRRLEHDEALQVENLKDGEAMMVISALPDAVRNGTTKIDGYSKGRAMVRIYVAQKGIVSSVSLSLDKSDYEGLQAVANVVGGNIQVGLGSEEILAKRFKFDATDYDTEWLPANIRQAYDEVLTQKYGGVWYGGTSFASKKDALNFIKQQPDLIAEHMAAISEILGKATGSISNDPRAEKMRQRFAAAVDARIHGLNVGSVTDAIVTDLAASGGYGNDCPTVYSSNSTGEQLSAMGMKQGNLLKCVKCPFCGKTVDAIGTSGGGIQCPECKKEAKGGKIIDHKAIQEQKKVRDRQLARKAILAQQKQRSGSTAFKNNIPKDYQYVGEKTGVGDAKKIYTNKKTGQTLEF